jgi:hypothetical protein
MFRICYVVGYLLEWESIEQLVVAPGNLAHEIMRIFLAKCSKDSHLDGEVPISVTRSLKRSALQCMQFRYCNAKIGKYAQTKQWVWT